jgi:uncharacterized protein
VTCVVDQAVGFQVLSYTFLLVVSLAAGWLSGVIGTGASLVLLPILVPMFGAIEAMPIMAIAGVMANLARVAAWHRQIDWRAVAVYTAAGMPAAYAGASILISLPNGLAEFLLGGFIVLLVPARRLLQERMRIGLAGLAVFGGGVGFLTGMFLSTGPLSVPAFLSYGLSGGAFLSTEAASSLFVQLSKLTSFRVQDALPGRIVLQGFIVGCALVLGTFMAKPFVIRLGDRGFRLILDAVTLVSGISLLILGSLDLFFLSAP